MSGAGELRGRSVRLRREAACLVLLGGLLAGWGVLLLATSPRPVGPAESAT